jgi:hypothetical protein
MTSRHRKTDIYGEKVSISLVDINLALPGLHEKSTRNGYFCPGKED